MTGDTGLKFFPLIIDRWLAGTRMMSLEAKGAYLEILLYLYEGRGRVIKDHHHVAKILGGIHGNKSRRIWKEIENKFVRNQYGFTHRLVGELQRNGGRIRGLGRGAYPGAEGGAEAGGFAHSTRTSTITPVVPFEIPHGIDAKAWSDFEQHRAEIRKPLTTLSRTKAANLLAALTPEQQQACVDMTIQNRWQGLFPEKVKRNGTSQSSAPGDSRPDWRHDL